MASVRMVGKVTARLLRSIQPLHCIVKTTRPVTFLHKVQQRSPLLGNSPAFFYSTLAPSSDLSLKYKHGRLVLEICRKRTLGPKASILSTDGERVTNTTLIHALLDKDFQLVINDAVYNVVSPEKVATSEQAMEMDDMKHVVHLLHTALHMPEHHMLKERQLLERQDVLKQELSPLEEVKAQLSRSADFHSARVVWTGLALLSVQGGALAWLTWWVYSWDVMEPVTYFITYATSIGAFSYYVLTKQDYLYPDVKDRQFLHSFYKGAGRKKFNVGKYNELKDELAEVEEDLRRLRNPTQFHFPLEQIQPRP
ncbi:hypothetical protein CgunFtcFv8_021755 [Champsocephalus gunnari]|uniref:Calcium uniporter protein n=1 Tax=Champsocephalus gunnari TaxID=52237 RepID=A0AAN8DNK8_CHAGU|nr:hypothetical protein CgunFtcFv8_021755 [Champsocephalus gunnari]